jgi:branched-chain amino acid transport system substrate-binding protein
VEAPFTEATKGDLTTQVTKCQQAGCDLVFLPIYTAEAVKVLTLAAGSDFDTKFFGCDGLDGILDAKDFDTSLAEGVMLLTPFDATAAENQAFVTAYTNKLGVAPNQFAADAYDVAYAIYQACVAGNVTADMTAEQINTIMVQQITSMSFDGLTGKAMTWGADGAVSKDPAAVIINGGKYVSIVNE